MFWFVAGCAPPAPFGRIFFPYMLSIFAINIFHYFYAIFVNLEREKTSIIKVYVLVCGGYPSGGRILFPLLLSIFSTNIFHYFYAIFLSFHLCYKYISLFLRNFSFIPSLLQIYFIISTQFFFPYMLLY
jgi:hypothetical protein